MSALTDRRILLGVTGGIAAYKSADLVRRLMAAEAEVRVVMTEAATRFVTPLTFQAVSGRPVHTTLLDEEAEAGMGHIELARWADAVLVAPASADALARLAGGHADDLLSTLCLATTAPLAVAPAMNHRMWRHPATRANVDRLTEFGVRVFGPGEGEQACGERGPGRMLEPEDIVARLHALFAPGPLHGLTVMVTAGPTQEALDPVRFIGNRSSGKMGFALAAAAAEAGARVILVAGPVGLPTPPGVERIDVRTAEEMRYAVMAWVGGCDIFIAAAAVADYRPRETASDKIKKDGEVMRVELVRNPDILAEVSGLEQRPFCVGFAAETERLEEHARAKLAAKGLDMVAANRVGGDLGFDSDDNALEVFWEGGGESLLRAGKRQLARQLIHLIGHRYLGREA